MLIKHTRMDLPQGAGLSSVLGHAVRILQRRFLGMNTERGILAIRLRPSLFRFTSTLRVDPAGQRDLLATAYNPRSRRSSTTVSIKGSEMMSDLWEEIEVVACGIARQWDIVR